MPGHPARDRLIQFTLALYAVFSLSAMAGMNISFLGVALTFVYLLMRSSFKGPVSLSGLPDFKRYLQFGGGLFVTCLLSLVVAKIYPVRYAGHAPEITVHGFFKIWYLFCPGILAVVFLSASDPVKTIILTRRAWWIATLILAPVAVIQFFTGWPLPQVLPTNPGRFHAILFFGHHLSTASIIIFPTFVALTQAVSKKIKQNVWDLFSWATSAAGLLILFLSYARAVWVSAPIGIALILFRYLKPRDRWLSLGAMVVFLAVGSQTSLVRNRVDSAMGVNDRVQLWIANIDFFKHNPITGIGWLKTAEMSEFYFKQIDPETKTYHFWGHAHNNFFEMLGGTGILGTVAFLCWSIFTFLLAYRASRPQTVLDASSPQTSELQDLAYGLGVGLVLLHINGLTNVTFWEGKVMHQQMLAVGLLLVIRALQKRQSSVLL